MLVTINSFALDNTTEFAGGDGTEENPYLISSAEHLDHVRNYLEANFKMVEDVVFSDQIVPTTEEFKLPTERIA